MLRGMLSVGAWTLLSRVTGFVRDVVMAAIMGAGPVADAFVVALRLPNHLRTIFGEGAFNSAFIPTYARLQTEGDRPARAFADRVFTLMLFVQAAVLALALVFMPQLVRLLAPGFSADPDRFRLAVELTRITFPFLISITFVTLVSAILNANGRFAAAAAAPVLMNVAIVAGLALAFLFPTPGHAAAWAVMVSGVLEYLLVTGAAFAIRREPWLARPRFDPEMKRFFRVLGPAIVGSAGVQIAMFADTVIASFLPPGAVSALYYADRLYQLPVGVIGIAAGTVLLPEMSRRVAAGDSAGAHGAQNRALGLTLALAAPFAVAFLMVPELIMSALFERGAFDAEAARRAGAVLAAYGVGLPAIVLIRSAVASFYSRSDTTTPLLASLTAVAINIGLKLVLTGPYGVVGLALATSIGAWTNLVLLLALAYGRGWAEPTAMLGRIAVAILVASALLALFVWGGHDPVARMLGGVAALRTELTLGLLGAGGLFVYAAALLLAARALRLDLART